jgi:hypothetical protein
MLSIAGYQEELNVGDLRRQGFKVFLAFRSFRVPAEERPILASAHDGFSIGRYGDTIHFGQMPLQRRQFLMFDHVPDSNGLVGSR